MKTAILYYSRHHGNTKKLIDAIAKKHGVTLIDAVENPNASLSGYDLVGFASGIYYSNFHKSVMSAIDRLPEGQRVFFLFTYGAKKDGYTKGIRKAVEKRSAKIAGEYGCFGFNTFGPFKLIGGIAKNHPDAAEIQGALDFYDALVK